MKNKAFILLKKILVFLFLIIGLQCEAKQHTISLGPNCAPALSLSYYKIRAEAYPFDWGICPFNSLFKLLETDFENFMLPENLVVRPGDPKYVTDTYTGVRYNHDFPTVHGTHSCDGETNAIGREGPIVENFLDYYPEIYEKYQRRIKRFREALLSTNEVIFVIYYISHNQAVQLRDFFENTYPQLNFKILVIHFLNAVNSKNDWNERKICDYKVTDWDWNMQAPGYSHTFKEMGLLPEEENTNL